MLRRSFVMLVWDLLFFDHEETHTNSCWASWQQVEDWRHDNREEREGDQQVDQQREPYEIERIAAILAITCMFLSAMYTIFAILLFLYAGTDDESLDEDAVVTHHHKPSSLPSFAPADRSDPRHDGLWSLQDVLNTKHND